MEKKRFTAMPRHKLTRYSVSPTGSKIAYVQPMDGDTSCWWYVWDKNGNYKGCQNKMLRRTALVEISKEEFLRD